MSLKEGDLGLLSENVVLSRDGVQGKGWRLSPFPWPSTGETQRREPLPLHAERDLSRRNRSRLACCIAMAASVSDCEEA
jgi:hypothetical protein